MSSATGASGIEKNIDFHFMIFQICHQKIIAREFKAKSEIWDFRVKLSLVEKKRLASSLIRDAMHQFFFILIAYSQGFVP